MASEVDIQTLSAFSSVPQAEISTLLNQPSIDLVTSFLRSISERAKDCEQVKSQKLRLEVELEQSVRTRESKVKLFKNSAEKALAEASKLRADLQASENSKTKLESDIEQIRSSSQYEASETTALKSRISTLESEHRQTVSILNSKNTAYDQTSGDLSLQHKKAVELRRQITDLEQAIQSQNSTLSSAKFREQSLSQELDLVKKNNDWLETELKTKQTDYAKFRQQKNAQNAELTRKNEMYISETETAKKSEIAWRNRLEDQTREVEQSKQTAHEEAEAKDSEIVSLKADVEAANRLADLQKEMVETEKGRVQDLISEKDQLNEAAADQIGQVRAIADTERTEKEAAEVRIEQLESKITQLEADFDKARAQPTTPARGTSGTGSTAPMRPGTPSGIFSPGSATRLKGHMTMTQMYSEYQNIERQLVSERREKEQLQATISGMMEDLQSNAPQMEELSSEIVKLQQESRELSALRQAASEERDRAMAQARIVEGEMEAKNVELLKLGQELRDVSAQVKYLLMEKYAQEHNIELSAEELARMEQEARAQDTSNLNATGRVISNNLTIFRNIAELHDMNLKIRTMLRTLGDRMENDETAQHEQDKGRLQSEIETLKKDNQNLKDLYQSNKTLMKSFERERDLYRGMASRKGPLSSLVDASDFSRSLPVQQGAPTSAPTGFGSQSIGPGSSPDSAKLLQDLQNQFDDYKHESESTRRSLKKQADDMSAQAQQVREDNIKKSSALSSATTLYNNLEISQKMLRDELESLRRSRDSAMEQAAQHQSKTQHLAESLVENNTVLDSTRREASNLKAEKDLWKQIESRLLDDNNTLRNDRSRLDQLNSSLQNMINEREQSDSETRRRLSAQVDSLEAELQTTKRRLEEEQEESKKVVLRRNFEHDQNQKRIDDLVSSLGITKEDLATTKSARDHLQARVDELALELRSAEERLAVLTQPAAQINDVNSADDTRISREQELAVEVSELRRDLDLKSTELERINGQVQVYKDISQASEERLQELSDANEQYREDTESALADKDKQIKDLQQRVDDISSELNTTNNELSQLRDAQNESDRRLDEQKVGFEAEITRLREAEEQSAQQAEFNLAASKAQAAIATEAQQNYENELQKHADAAKNHQQARAEANELRLQIRGLESLSGTSKDDLRQKEESWQSQQNRFEQEITDLKTRHEEVLSQNSILHSQLETLTKQISALQRDRGNIPAVMEGTTSAPDRDEMQEVVRFLRREKEIVDIQYHLSTQTAKGLQQQLDSVNRQLDDARSKLTQQRSEALVSEQNALSHSQLMDRLNELNLFRESNTTLRTENHELTRVVTEKMARVDELETRLQPLNARIGELENTLALREGEKDLLQKDRDHWQQRTQNILSKYDRVDPEEMESLKGKLATAESERDSALSAQSELQVQVDSIPEKVTAARKDMREGLQDQFKGRVKDLNARIKDKQTEIDTLTAERDNLHTELHTTKQELEQTKASSQHPTTNGVERNDAAEGDDSEQSHLAELESQVSQLQTSLAEKEQEFSTLKTNEDAKFKQRESNLKEILNKRFTEFKKEAQNAKEQALADLEQQLKSQHQAELEHVRATAASGTAESAQAGHDTHAEVANANATITLPTDDEGIPVVSELHAKVLVRKNSYIVNLLKDNIRKRLEKRESELRKEFEEQKLAEPALHSEDAAVLEQRFSEDKEAIIKEKEAEYQAEKEALLKRQEKEIESTKQELLAEHQKDTAKKIADNTALVEKKFTLQKNLAENRAKLANLKLDIVKKAVEETPQKPVAEVYEIAKDAKIPAIVPKAPSQPNPTQSEQATAIKRDATPAQTSAAVHTGPQEAASSGSPQPNGQQQLNVGTGPATFRQLQSGLPRGGSVRGRGGAHINTNLPPTQNATREVRQSSGLPRGTGIPRGALRGRGGARGANTGVQTSISQAAARQPSGSGSLNNTLNPQAVQFTPSKRALEDGGETGNVGKKIRGASGSAPSTSS